MTAKSLNSLLAAVAVLGLAACGSAPPVPEDHFYRLKAVFAAAPAAVSKLDGTLEVERFVADGLTSERSIVYSAAGKPNQVHAYHYHFWVKPPTVMLRDEMVSFLRASNVAKTVVTPEMRVGADYILTGKIEHLEQVQGKPERTLLEIELGLRRAHGGKLMLLKTYRVENDIHGQGVPAAVDSLNTALSIAYADFLADLSKI